MKQSVHFRLSPDLLDALRARAEATGQTLTGVVESLCWRSIHTTTQTDLSARVSKLEDELAALKACVQIATNVDTSFTQPVATKVDTLDNTLQPINPVKPVATKVPTKRTTNKRTKSKPRGAGFSR